LGYRFDGTTLTLTLKTLQKMAKKWQQLYEYARKKITPEDLTLGAAE
jgi:hypothetical protein